MRRGEVYWFRNSAETPVRCPTMFVTKSKRVRITPMAIDRLRLPDIVPIVMIWVVILAFAWAVGVFVTIQLRLARNGAVAQAIVEALHNDYPGVRFRGGASYERETICISVVEGQDKLDREDLDRWLRAKRIDERIQPVIWLTFTGGIDDQSTMIGP